MFQAGSEDRDGGEISRNIQPHSESEEPFRDSRQSGGGSHPGKAANAAKGKTRGKDPFWVVPYIDQALDFWKALRSQFGSQVKAVYLPLTIRAIGSGRPPQPRQHLPALIKSSLFACSVLVNPIYLPEPAESLAPAIIEELRRLGGECELESVTVTNLTLAERIRASIPRLSIFASTLMDIGRPNQVPALRGICDGLVPSSRIMRDLPALKALREAFPGRLRLIVNEACLPGCPFRVQHFFEMGNALPKPKSLCKELLAREPWMRLTGAWVLPQHLHLFDGIYDELKLAGRVTLRDPFRFLEVLAAYVHRRPLTPDRIGGGPAAPQRPIVITEEFYSSTLHCGQLCHECRNCPDYYGEAMRRLDRH